MKRVLSAFAFMTLVVVGLLLPTPASAAGVAAGWDGDKVTVKDGAFVFADGGSLTATLDATADTLDPATGFGITVSGEGACGAGAPRLIIQGFKLEGHVLPCTGGEQVVVKGLNDLTWYTWGGNTKFPSWDDALATVDDSVKMGLTGLVFDNNPERTATVVTLKLFGDVVAAQGPQPELTEVSAKEPTVVAPTCTTEGTVTETPVTGVKYQRVEKDGTIGLVAKAEPGFKLTGKTRFGPYPVAKLTGPECQPKPNPEPPTNPEPPVENPPAGEEPEVPAPGTPNTPPSPSDSLSPVPGAVGGSTGGDLPKTGVKALTIGGFGGLLVAVGGLLFVWARRRRDQEPGTHREDGDTQVMPTI